MNAYVDRIAAPMAASPLRWPVAAGLALLLHLLLYLLPWAADPFADPGSQNSAGAVQGAGEGRVSVLELRFAPAAMPAGAGAARIAESAASQEAGGGGQDSYYARLRVHLQRHRRALLATAGARGTSVVTFRVSADGVVSGLRLERSAGNAALDAEALDLLRRAAPLPAPPQGRGLQLSVPIVFE